MSICVVGNVLTLLPFTNLKLEKLIIPTNAGGAGCRFLSERLRGVAGRGNGGNDSPALRLCGFALGGCLALGLSKLAAEENAAKIINIIPKNNVFFFIICISPSVRF